MEFFYDLFRSQIAFQKKNGKGKAKAMPKKRRNDDEDDGSEEDDMDEDDDDSMTAPSFSGFGAFGSSKNANEDVKLVFNSIAGGRWEKTL